MPTFRNTNYSSTLNLYVPQVANCIFSPPCTFTTLSLHFCSALRFTKVNHNRATLCLSIAHLIYSVPLLYFATPFHVLPIRIFALPYFANALHFFTSHCSAALFLYLTMRNLSLLCQNVSTLFYSITLPFCTAQCHSVALPCYAMLRRSKSLPNNSAPLLYLS